MSITLRPYQLDAIQQCRDRITSGRVAPLCIAPTGAGKTLIMGSIVTSHIALDPSHRVLVVAHRRELIGQMTRALMSMGLPMHDIGEIIPGVTQRPMARVQVASTQTLRARNMHPNATLKIFDECVTGDTMIGGARAESIKVGDFVPSWNDDRKAVVWRKVSRVFVNKAESLLVLRVAENALTCTPAHPIWVSGRGYVYAGEVRVGDMCRVRETVTERRARSKEKDVQQVVRVETDNVESRAAIIRTTWATSVMHCVHRTCDYMVCGSVAVDMQPRVLEQDTLAYGRDHEPRIGIAAHDDAQSDALARVEGEDGCYTAKNWPTSSLDRRQGEGSDRTSASPVDGAGSRVGSGASDRSEGSIYESPSMCLPGPSTHGNEACDRSGRRFACNLESEGFRSAENDVPQFARVDSVEVLEPGSDGSFGGRAREGVVYNFEVEGEHNFFANGILTHNCHHYSSDDWSTLASGDCLRIGFTATPMRSDGRGMSPAFDSLVVVSTIKELTALGYLVPCRVIAPAKPLKRPNMTHSPVDAYLAHANGTRTVVFADFVSNAEKFVSEFREKGINAVVIHGSLSDVDRKRALEAHARGAVLVNCMVLTEGWDCLSEDTEILTPRGWASKGMLQVGDTVHSLNRKTGLLEVVPVEGTTNRLARADERMLTIKSQHVDIRTTENHRFYVKTPSGTKRTLPESFELQSGTEVANRWRPYTLPIAAMPAVPHNGIYLTDDEIRFVAWFMTDGGFQNHGRQGQRRNGSVVISQAKQNYVSEIRCLLTRLGFDFTERVRSRGHGGYANALPLHEFRIPKGTDSGSKKRTGWHARFAPYLDKNVAASLHSMTREQFLVFWEEALKGDGQQSKGKAGWLWCDRIEQADAYERMSLERGLSASHKRMVTKSGHVMYRVSVRDKQWITTYPTDPRSARTELSAPREGEHVWCVTNRNGTIVTRRNGKIVIIGNSPGTTCCILARGCGSVGTYLQIVGRVLRPCEGKTEALLIDLTGRSFYDHGAPDADRKYSLTGKGIRTKDEDEGKQAYCPVCGQPVEEAPNSWPCAICGHQPAGQVEAPRYTGDELLERYAGKRTEDEDKRVDSLARWYAEAKSRVGDRGKWAALAKYKAVYGESAPPGIERQAAALAQTLACVTCTQCQRVTARTYRQGKCGRCAFAKDKTG